MYPPFDCILFFVMAAFAFNVTAESQTRTTATTVRWQHPAGLVTEDTIAEVKAKIAGQEWARQVLASRKTTLDRWLNVPLDDFRKVFPRMRGNVYHNFSCPRDRCRLSFDPFVPTAFKCPLCSQTFPPETDAGIYSPGDRYHGTMYDGWVCLFYLEAGNVAADMGLMGRLAETEAEKYTARGVEILNCYADTIEHLATKFDKDRQMSVLLTYHREGDSKVLFELACAYELLRESMSADQCSRFERVVLERMLNDIMLEPIYHYNHNNLYQWHRTIVQTALTLERDDLVDWSFGYGMSDPDHQPEHRSVRRLVATHFKPDGAFWEMCSGYHLYPLNAFCELAVVARHLSKMDPRRFPPDGYDLTDPSNPGAQVIRNALAWFMAMALPDRTMPTIGDSMAPRAGMDDYYTTAEVGYRYFGLKEVGDYESLRHGSRTWGALLYGAPRIEQTVLSCTSSYLSSGWVSLRNDWHGNKVWIGLNALIPGGGHQHADRLTLLSFSNGKLLGLEKATPYNESVTRVLGTLSPSHGTVTVDRASPKKGDTLVGQELPKVAMFVAGPVAKFAELHADHLYPQTSVYRRSVVLIEDFYVDLFRVCGGTTHDWMIQHAGSAPWFSMTMRDASFEPADWLSHGTNRIRHALVDDAWDARWRVDDVTSRITMLDAAGTEVYALETYPIDNAVITPQNPPCQTLCVRRHDDSAFLVVGDAWKDKPNLETISRSDHGEAVRLKTSSNIYYVIYGPGSSRFDDGISLATDAAFAAIRSMDAVTMVMGTRLDLTSPRGSLHVKTVDPISVFAEWFAGTVTFEVAGDIHYDTYGGVDHDRPAPRAAVTFDGDLWPITKQQRRDPTSSPADHGQ